MYMTAKLVRKKMNFFGHFYSIFGDGGDLYHANL